MSFTDDLDEALDLCIALQKIASDGHTHAKGPADADDFLAISSYSQEIKEHLLAWQKHVQKLEAAPLSGVEEDLLLEGQELPSPRVIRVKDMIDKALSGQFKKECSTCSAFWARTERRLSGYCRLAPPAPAPYPSKLQDRLPKVKPDWACEQWRPKE